MTFIIDDLLGLPFKIGEIVLNSIAQTSHTLAWVRYQSELRKKLIQAKRDLEQGKLSQAEFKKVEAYIFSEMRVAKQVVESKARR